MERNTIIEDMRPQGGYTTVDLSEITLELDSIKDNLFIIRHSFSHQERPAPSVLESGFFVIERALEKLSRELLSIPYRPRRDRHIRLNFDENETMKKLGELPPLVGGGPEYNEVLDVLEGMKLPKTENNIDMITYGYMLGLARGREQET